MTRYSRKDLSHKLASSIAEEVASAAIARACNALGLEAESLSEAQAMAVLERVSTEDGMVGIASRLAVNRLNSKTQADAADALEQTPRRDLGSLAAMIRASVGQEHAVHLMRQAARECGLGNLQTLDEQEAMQVFEQLATKPGIVGVSARFAKMRLHLSFAG